MPSAESSTKKSRSAATTISPRIASTQESSSDSAGPSEATQAISRRFNLSSTFLRFFSIYSSYRFT
ncbi:MAG: hypothetical protein A2X93_06540 [Deltaproteobacteria bacterium GWC2_56_8]|nr:MAG: hypothetical protein A2X93_06540 [Deltaproteobacteria bacterium GWC2_56_8]